MENKSQALKQLNFCKLSEHAIAPKRATAGSAGYDLCACISEPIILNPGKRTSIPCGVAIELPSNKYAAFIFARSGLGVKKGITLSNGVGVVDSDYRGEIGVGLCNLSEEAYTIQPGERIAQMVIMNVETPMLNLCENLNETSRGEGGFGSTGK